LSRDRFEARTSEHWQPPAFRALHGRRSRVIARVRRAVDLQAASIWRDLRGELKGEGGDVLDVGCGAQPYRTLFPRRARYRAIDIAQAKARFGYHLPDTEYFEGSRWPVCDTSIDLVLATETLEHVREPPVFLSEARRVLRPGGRLVLTVPFSARWHYIPHDYWRFTPSCLSILLKEAGFLEVAVYARGNELTVVCNKIMSLMMLSLVRSRGHFFARQVVVLTFSLVPVLVLLGQLSLLFGGGDDCLGWTVVAE
jgi:SAM-dependent methyltransferase